VKAPSSPKKSIDHEREKRDVIGRTARGLKKNDKVPGSKEREVDHPSKGWGRIGPVGALKGVWRKGGGLSAEKKDEVRKTCEVQRRVVLGKEEGLWREKNGKVGNGRSEANKGEGEVPGSRRKEVKGKKTCI